MSRSKQNQVGHDIPYMTDFPKVLLESSKSRIFDLEQKKFFREASPKYKTTLCGDTILMFGEHEIMGSYQAPYMEVLGEIVTRNGGDILNVGYGLGLVDNAIEGYRGSRCLGLHYVIELNRCLAKRARLQPNLEVVNDDWREAISKFESTQFDGIIYDGFPNSAEELHRDGVIFIEKMMCNGILKPNGVLTFFVDSPKVLGSKFLSFLEDGGLFCEEIVEVPIERAVRTRPNWPFDHFLAPVIRFVGCE